jgi:hypothetical protein
MAGQPGDDPLQMGQLQPVPGQEQAAAVLGLFAVQSGLARPGPVVAAPLHRRHAVAEGDQIVEVADRVEAPLRTRPVWAQAGMAAPPQWPRPLPKVPGVCR